MNVSTVPYLAAALSDARTQVAAAETVDLNDDLAVIASQAALAVSLRRVLWVLNEDDDEPDVAAQVAAEDGVTRPVYVRYQRGPVAA